jgi:type IV secretory pathway TrbD component
MQGHRFHKSSFRPHLLMGAERKSMLLLILMCISLAVTSVNLVALSIAAGLWIFIHPLLVCMGMIDPDLIGVYFAHRITPGSYLPLRRRSVRRSAIAWAPDTDPGKSGGDNAGIEAIKYGLARAFSWPDRAAASPPCAISPIS